MENVIIIEYPKTSLERFNCVKIVRNRSFSAPYFPAFGLNAHQKNSDYRHFSRSVYADDSDKSSSRDFFSCFIY